MHLPHSGLVAVSAAAQPRWFDHSSACAVSGADLASMDQRAPAKRRRRQQTLHSQQPLQFPHKVCSHTMDMHANSVWVGCLPKGGFPLAPTMSASIKPLTSLHSLVVCMSRRVRG